MRFSNALFAGALLALASLGTATLINARLASLLAPPPVGPFDAVSLSADNQPDQPAASYVEGILCRNLFDATAIATCRSSAKPSATHLTLMATAVAQPSNLSSALMLTSGRASAVSVGDRIGDAEMVGIATNHVQLRYPNKRIITIPLTASPTASVATASSGNATLTRATLEQLAENPLELSQLGRVSAHRDENGNTTGYRVSAVRRGTLPHAIGLRNGDVIHQVGGFPLNSPQDALHAWEQLRNADSAEALITRRGRRTTLHFAIE